MRSLRVQTRLFSGLASAALLVCVSGCQQQINFPAPTLTAISPTEIQAGEPAFKITVSGRGFTPSSAVVWGSAAVPSATLVGTYNSATGQIIAQVPASFIQSPGQAFIAVETPQPGGGVSGGAPDCPATASPPTDCVLTINPNPSAVPQITGLSPRSAGAGGPALTLTVSGKDFVSQSVVFVNGSARTTFFSNSTMLQTTLSAGDIASAGTLQISVTNPPPVGGSSNAMGFSVNNPVPGLISLSPTSALAGSASVSLVLTGANYVPQSVVLINGAPRITAFSSATQIGTTLNAGDLTQGGLVRVQVENPAPGGGTSSAQVFAINPTEGAGLPELVDYGFDGTQANNGICGTLATCSSGIPSLTTAGPSISNNGQFVAFASTSTNLLQNQGNAASAIFVRDTCLSSTTTTGGASSCFPSTLLTDLGINNAQPNGPADQPSIDGTGAHVAYTSTATNLVSYASVDGIHRQVYWQSTCTSGSGSTGCSASGVSGTAALVSVAADGVTPGNGDSHNPVISPDGQYVAFVSLATNLVSGVTVDGVTPQVYIRNTCNVVPPAMGSCTPATYLVSTPDGTTPGNNASAAPSIANSGLFVAFTSQANNLLGSGPNSKFTGVPEVFERSTCVTTLATVGGTCVPSTRLISSPDQVTPADGVSGESSVSEDGRFVAFASTAQNLIPGVGPTQQVYVTDTCAGVATATQCTYSTNLVSTPDGTTPAIATAEYPSINQCVGSTTTTLGCGT
ncbi:MAG: PD40 domain-containing protein, partial [Acidobacteriota bacterium]|nr:PD40 domain-containing protein [Acidobacteriota bacterium]